MDHPIHCLSNLEIETQHPHSSSSSQKEDEVKINLLELPPDVLSLIFMKLGTIDILASAQWVCTSWWTLSKQPHLFRSIHVEQVLTLFGSSVHDFTFKLSVGLAREAIDRSGGQLVEFSVWDIATDEILLYMSEKPSSLRCIRLVYCNGVSDGGLIQMAKKLPLLEELEIIHGTFSKEVFETFGLFCPLLKSCRLNYMNYFSGDMFLGVAVAIEQNMPNLRYLHLFGNRILNVNLRAILDGCPLLEFLDLRQCFDLNISECFKRCGNIKVRFPNDPTDDFEYELYEYDYSRYDSDDDDPYNFITSTCDPTDENTWDRRAQNSLGEYVPFGIYGTEEPKTWDRRAQDMKSPRQKSPKQPNTWDRRAQDRRTFITSTYEWDRGD